MILLFTLSMPNSGSWNGKWSGEGRLYCKKRTVPKETLTKILGDSTNKGFYYNFGDGWGASVKVQIVTSQDAAKMVRKSAGFCGYDWMIDEIVQHGRILGMEERNGKI